MSLQYKSFENTSGKGEIAALLLLFTTVYTTVYTTLSENFLLFSSNSKLLSANSFSLEESKICRLRKGLALFSFSFSTEFFFLHILVSVKNLLGMVTSIDLNTRVLGHSSDRLLGRFFFTNTAHIAQCHINRAARKVPLERNQAADFRVPVQFIQQFSVSFIHLQSSEKKSFHDRIITAILEHNK